MSKDTSDLPVYVFIDASNIRMACNRSMGFELDFARLYSYLQSKYPNLKSVRYYEGIARGDKGRLENFRFLKSIGYTICPLERKCYSACARYKETRCKKCGTTNRVQVLATSQKLKSNVDVFLVSNMFETLHQTRIPIHIILLSCDGDYAEAIRSVFCVSPDSKVSVLATPHTKRNNCLSIRLKELRKEFDRGQYNLVDIANIRDLVKKDKPKN